MNAVVKYLSSITVEPVGFFGFAGQALYGIGQGTLVYNAVCEQKYQHIVDADCSDLRSSLEAETYTQKQASRWLMYLSLFNLVPVLFADTILGELCL